MHLAVAADNYDGSSLYVQVREAHTELQSKSEEVDDMITAAQAKDADNTRLWDQVRYADMGTPLIHDCLLHLARHCIIRCKKSTAHALICLSVQHSRLNTHSCHARQSVNDLRDAQYSFGCNQPEDRQSLIEQCSVLLPKCQTVSRAQSQVVNIAGQGCS